MNFKIVITALFTLFFCSIGFAEKRTSSQIEAKVVYGNDDRLDLWQIQDPQILSLARSTAALVKNSQLSDNGNGYSQLNTSHYGNAYNLCTDEPFFEQDTAAFCSGSLVGDDLMVTAGHCISELSCAAVSFVFDFALHSPLQKINQVSNDNVYKCQQVIKSVVIGAKEDYAVVRLDRKVIGASPLKVRQTGSLNVGDNLMVIGHPAGLPTKVAGGATVRRIENEFYVTDLDTYGGNSGSAVFNQTTGEVEGILVRGEMDFKSRGSCRVSNVCGQTACRGEDVTKINYVLPYIGQ